MNLAVRYELDAEEFFWHSSFFGGLLSEAALTLKGGLLNKWPAWRLREHLNAHPVNLHEILVVAAQYIQEIHAVDLQLLRSIDVPFGSVVLEAIIRRRSKPLLLRALGMMRWPRLPATALFATIRDLGQLHGEGIGYFIWIWRQLHRKDRERLINGVVLLVLDAMEAREDERLVDLLHRLCLSHYQLDYYTCARLLVQGQARFFILLLREGSLPNSFLPQLTLLAHKLGDDRTFRYLIRYVRALEQSLEWNSKERACIRRALTAEEPKMIPSILGGTPRAPTRATDFAPFTWSSPIEPGCQFLVS